MLAAAHRLFTVRGYAATTTAAVAGEAEVAVQALHFIIAAKRAVLTEPLDVSVAGDAEPMATLGRPWVAEAPAARTDPWAGIDAVRAPDIARSPYSSLKAPVSWSMSGPGARGPAGVGGGRPGPATAHVGGGFGLSPGARRRAAAFDRSRTPAYTGAA
ncbi:TetR family transcriptional regulator [Embleya hyalina]|uniref:TetR family transcriptional regulator n=1 Tax=Embleya hyalina TaxID=516124 RepID=UPI000F84B845|nr:TetR family transcriptional regulator [Embleya hyalina]